jgi:ABC-type Zn2+ transport system substrate-binding protein/surface adhesin
VKVGAPTEIEREEHKKRKREAKHEHRRLGVVNPHVLFRYEPYAAKVAAKGIMEHALCPPSR